MTIANPETGVGALQFSAARYKSGKLPHIQCDDLTDLLSQFAVNRGLKDPFDEMVSSDGISVVAASFHSGDDLIRVWYVSDTKNLILVTYVCNWEQRDTEADNIETIVRSIRFYPWASE